jgi:hypothetical protein
MIPKIVEADSASHKSYAIYEIETDLGPHYMRVERSPAKNEDRMVIVVDSSRFLGIWKHKLATSDPVNWVRVPGFADVQKRFVASKKRPVRLARAEIHRNFLVALCARIIAAFKLERTIHSRDLTIVEGERRTLWLLANGAATFPLECATRYAAELHRMIGVASIPPVSVESLTSTH